MQTIVRLYCVGDHGKQKEFGPVQLAVFVGNISHLQLAESILVKTVDLKLQLYA